MALRIRSVNSNRKLQLDTGTEGLLCAQPIIVSVYSSANLSYFLLQVLHYSDVNSKSQQTFQNSRCDVLPSVASSASEHSFYFRLVSLKFLSPVAAADTTPMPTSNVQRSDLAAKSSC
jgi:hypothetical protein